MSKSLKNLTVGWSGLAIASISSIGFASSASAFSFVNNTVGVGTEDLNKSFTVKFDGNVSTQTVSGLTSEATFKFLGFAPTSSTTTTGKGKNQVTTTLAQTIAQFEVVLKNTSSGVIGSRVSALGFNTDQEEAAATSSGLFALGQLGGAFPNQFGAIDVCYTNGNTCQGGQNGGVNNKESLPGTFQQGSFLASLTLNGAVNSFSMSNLGVRYQSISGTSLGTSGTGRSVLFIPPVTPPPTHRKVPEPTAIGALMMTALAALRFKKKRNQESWEA
ncbi:MAG: cistern family PEP-CTERM protein [Leptolyngbyaceae cyanobacterium CSU_1_4]|nr:cistern family PEP-CTERM protein [Leptolyngbyaceae cyanobacterium CSU_1_4]